MPAERGATYLGPRLANDFSVLANGKFGKVGYDFFYIDPNELEWLELESTFLGANLSYDFSDDLTGMRAGSRYRGHIRPTPIHTALTLEREGLNTFAGHALWRNFGAHGVFLEGEIAHQSHPEYSMSAWAGYGTIGYIARELPWTPSISYRYSYFSGDDPRHADAMSATIRC